MDFIFQSIRLHLLSGIYMYLESFLESRPLQRILRDATTLADELGVQCYVVGGFVRDLLLNRPNDDIDFVVEVTLG